MKKKSEQIVIIGGLFDDCHRVGVDIIEKSLMEEGYQVVNLGITTPLDTFLRCAEYADIILISSINGHAFEHLAKEEAIFSFEQFRRKNPDFPVIIGGNLHSYKAPEYIKEFLEKKVGFTNVIVKPVSSGEVVSLTNKYLLKSTNGNLHYRERLKKLQEIVKAEFVNPEYRELTNISNDIVDARQVVVMKKEFQILWRTAKEVLPIDEILNRQLQISSPMHKILRRADSMQKTLIQPRCGVGSHVEQEYIFRRLSEAGADILSFQIDSNTRNGEFFENEKLLNDKLMINGYPLINHSVAITKRIVDRVGERPVQVRHGSKPKISVLLAYLSLSAGVSGFEGGAGTYLFPYFKSIPLSVSIYYWQYVDRIMGILAEKGCIIDREFFGTLTATLIPPEIAISFNIIETLLAAKQGVKSISLGYAEQGNRVQDIAALLSLRSLTRHYLDTFGYGDVEISTVLNGYMAGFPVDRGKAQELIRESAVTARLGRATRIMIKTIPEALHIPTLEDNIQAIGITERGFFLADTYYKGRFDNTAVRAERELIEGSVKSIIDSVLESGSGDIARGFVNALKNRCLDVPFSPNFQAKGGIITLRDCEGAVRIYEPGNIPLPKDIREIHKALIRERMRKEGVKKASTLIYEDVNRITQGDYVRWPLDGHYVAAAPSNSFGD
jgi:methylaspartate mutase epsilon subunit